MLQALRRRWFLLLLMVILALGTTQAQALARIADLVPRNLIIGSVLLAMALPLRLESIWATLSRPAAALLAITVNLLVVPLLAWCASLMLNEELALGMIIAAAVPCTLASAAVWTRMAGGNHAVSLLVTLITNLSCFIVTPALIRVFSGQTEEKLSFADTALKLLLLIVLPIVLAQLFRLIPEVASLAAQYHSGLSTYAQLGILAIVFVGAVKCGSRLELMKEQSTPIVGQLVLMFLLVAVVHLVAWWFGFWATGRMGASRTDQIAAAFAGSQKTLMVGLAIALPYGGLTILPMLAYHVEQLLIDTWLADRLARSNAEP